jgi:predicted unusual protein kinase regulating ubiquinone biosynthesis (AarF/ABC1/UbiB family)
VLVMEWIDGVRCTDPASIRASGLDLQEFIRCGVVTGMKQLLELGLFHGDPHPGNIFALADGRIAYVDFGNVAELSQKNKQTLIDAVVHAVNEDYQGMADDFVQLGFLAPGTDTKPIVPALEKIWADSMGQSMANFNFRLVTSKFNELVYQYPIRIPERFALVIRSLLTQEGICLTLDPDFKFLEVAYPYVAKRLLTDEDPALRERLFQVLFQDGKFQWKRLENLIGLAKEGSGGLDLSDTVRDGAKVLLLDEKLRRQLLLALTEDNRLHVEEVQQLYRLIQGDINPQKIVQSALFDLPAISRQLMLGWSDRVLSS